MYLSLNANVHGTVAFPPLNSFPGFEDVVFWTAKTGLVLTGTDKVSRRPSYGYDISQQKQVPDGTLLGESCLAMVPHISNLQISEMNNSISCRSSFSTKQIRNQPPCILFPISAFGKVCIFIILFL